MFLACRFSLRTCSIHGTDLKSSLRGREGRFESMDIVTKLGSSDGLEHLFGWKRDGVTPQVNYSHASLPQSGASCATNTPTGAFLNAN